jgi:fibronectin type III domain protein
MKLNKVFVVTRTVGLLTVLLFYLSCNKTTTQPPPVSRPTTPSGLSVTNVSENSLTLNWNASTANGGVKGYTTYIGSDSFKVNALSYTFGGLSSGTIYSLGVAAFDSYGNYSIRGTTTGTTLPPPISLLYYGGDQQDAPTLSTGNYEAAARFTPAKIGNFVGKTIKEIQYYIASKPDSIIVKLYGPLNDKTPGALLYSADVTSTAEAYKWNIHQLTFPLTLKNEDIWLSIAFKLSSDRKTVGCDPGPALPDGDWLYNGQGGQWIPFHQWSGTSINWTIRLNVE